MIIQRLYIGDFGILRNQTMNDLAPGLIVIGGLNRAGKSTLMTALSRLGSGFTKSSQLPPPNNKYYIESDIVLEEGRGCYNLRLDGYAAPSLHKISLQGVDGLSASDIYHVDAFTYQQLFTISLDQLQKLPRDVEHKELLRLQSVLLGAGLNDIVEIPRLELQFRKESKDLGGVTGNIKNKGFKPFFDQMKDGMEKKERAQHQVIEYKQKQSELKEMEISIQQVKQTMDTLQARVILLDLLKNNFDIYQEISDLTIQCSCHDAKDIALDFPLENLDVAKAYYEPYRSSQEEYDCQYRAIQEAAGMENIDHLIMTLLHSKGEIEKAYADASGIRERIDHIRRLKDDASSVKSEWLLRVRRIHSQWSEDNLVQIEGMCLDILLEDRLMEAVAGYKQTAVGIHEVDTSIQKYERDVELLKNQKNTDKLAPMTSALGKYVLLFIVVGIFSAVLYQYIHPMAGIFLSFIGISSVALMISYQLSGQRIIMSKLSDHDRRIQELQQRIGLEMNHREELLQKQDHWRDCLTMVSRQIGIDMDVSPDRLLEIFKALKDLQDDINKHKQWVKEIESINQGLKKDMEVMWNILKELREVPTDFSFNQDHYEQILNEVGVWYQILRQVTALQGIIDARRSMMDRLRAATGGNPEDTAFIQVLHRFIHDGERVAAYHLCKHNLRILQEKISRTAQTDRIRKAVTLLNPACTEDNQDYINYLYLLFEDFNSVDHVTNEYHTVSKQLEDESSHLEALIDSRQKLRNQLEQLGQSADIVAAQRQIMMAKSAMQPTAYRYAVLKTAAALCSKIKDNFLNSMKEDLLINATNLLREMTEGELSSLHPGDDLKTADFNVISKDGSKVETVDVLSRGTREQVFLAVRLGRIMDIDPPLPVLIDDTLVNFDYNHLHKALEIISKLSRTHQVFIVTCHAHLINLISKINPSSQYWRIEDGSITNTDAVSLIHHLQHQSTFSNV